jgi:outer membrane protein assembly factor BamB
MKRVAGLAVLAVITVAGLAPATALARPRAVASPRAEAGASVPGGTKLWAARYRGQAKTNIAVAVTASPDGSTVFVAGFSGTVRAHFSTVAYNAATGAQRWAVPFYGHGYTQAYAMAVSPDGSKLFVTGFTTPVQGGSERAVTVAYDAGTGARLWTQQAFPISSTFNVGTAVAVSPDGATVFVGGTAGRHIALVAYDAATGVLRWLAHYQPAGAANGNESLAVSPDGSRVFLTGPFRGSSGPVRSATIAYDAGTGAQLWAEVASGNTGTGSHELAVSPDGSAVYVTGWLGQGSPTSSFTTIAYDATTGAQLWARSYQGPGKLSVPEAIALSPDGSRLFVTGGSSQSPTGVVDFATVAYDTANGAVLWSRSYQPPATSEAGPGGAFAAGVSPDGTRVFVAGSSPGSRPKSSNYTTIAYDTATGHTSWLARYRGRQDFGAASSLAVGPTGQAVFVTGYLHGHVGSLIFGTVAYQP